MFHQLARAVQRQRLLLQDDDLWNLEPSQTTRFTELDKILGFDALMSTVLFCTRKDCCQHPLLDCVLPKFCPAQVYATFMDKEEGAQAYKQEWTWRDKQEYHFIASSMSQWSKESH